jgi:hypothetical protein
MFYNPVIVKSCRQSINFPLGGRWLGFGCPDSYREAKLNVVFLCRQVRRQNTSFNFAKGWLSRCLFCLFIVALSVFLGLLVTSV